jgi:FAD/FMN-containing dehydrogenase
VTVEASVSRPLGAANICKVEESLRGRLVQPHNDDYHDARAVWNGTHDRLAPPIVACAGVADVVRAAELARSEDPVVAVRGGGHSLPGFSTCDGGSTNQDGQ